MEGHGFEYHWFQQPAHGFTGTADTSPSVSTVFPPRGFRRVISATGIREECRPFFGSRAVKVRTMATACTIDDPIMTKSPALKTLGLKPVTSDFEFLNLTCSTGVRETHGVLCPPALDLEGTQFHFQHF